MAKENGRKSWCYWMELIKGERLKLCDAYPYPLGSPWSLSEKEQGHLLVQNDDAACAACERLILDGKWPDMEPEVRYAVTCRLETAEDLAANLYFAQGTRTRVVLRPPDMSITPINEVWKFFLIDWWIRSRPRHVEEYQDKVLLRKREKRPTFITAEMRVRNTPVTVVLVTDAAMLTDYDAEKTAQDFRLILNVPDVVLCRPAPTGEYCFKGEKKFVDGLLRRRNKTIPWKEHTVAL